MDYDIETTLDQYLLARIAHLHAQTPKPPDDAPLEHHREYQDAQLVTREIRKIRKIMHLHDED